MNDLLMLVPKYRNVFVKGNFTSAQPGTSPPGWRARTPGA